jgi:hypothetical protein
MNGAEFLRAPPSPAGTTIDLRRFSNVDEGFLVIIAPALDGQWQEWKWPWEWERE